VTERRLLTELKKVLKKLKLPASSTPSVTSSSRTHDARDPDGDGAIVVGHVDDEIIKLWTHIHDSARRRPCSVWPRQRRA